MLKKKDYSLYEVNTLIEKCRKADRRAQFEIYRRYSKTMYNTTLRIVNDPPDAEDVMQEAFLSAFKKLDLFSGEVTFGAWLKKIVVNKSIDHVRTVKARFQVLEELDNQKIEVEKAETENDVDIKTAIKDIKKAIGELPEGYRIIISLYLIEGYDHEEIAQILQISASTSRSQFVRARKKLAGIIKSQP